MSSCHYIFMVNPFEQTPAEKEEYVLDMLDHGYSYTQIMKECHVSPNTISNVKEKFFGSTEDDTRKSASQISKETQALKLFGEGKTLFQVATELDIATDFVFAVYQNFQRLRNLQGFISSFEHVKGNIQPYLHLFDLMNSFGMTPEQVAEQVRYGYDLPYLRSTHSSLSNDIWVLESQKQYSSLQLSFMRNQLQQYNASLEFYENECENKRKELLALCSEIDTRKKFIQNFDNEMV